jgi:hypothetical protein
MFGSQALEVAIGLTLVFFLFAAAASSVVEVISALWQKRAKDLEAALGRMLGGQPPAPKLNVPTSIPETSVFKGISPVTKRGIWPVKWGETKPSYLSAKAFADATAEIIGKAKEATGTAEELYDALPQGLRARLQPVLKDVGADATAIKAELESWFDDTMDRLAGAYKRWAQVWLFGVGLVIVIAANASAYRIAVSLYNDPAVRSAVTESASSAVTESASTTAGTGGTSSDPESIKKAIDSVADTVDNLDSLGLPVGWDNWNEPGGTFLTAGGWLVTALMIMLGAPFWFGVLSKLVSLRSAGERPPTASDQERSATSRMAPS